VSEQLARQR
jgi:hypothetical protein